MKALTSLKGEFRNIFTNKALLIAVLGVLFIPVLYSGTFLWAFWDPYGQVDQLPVAVVNNDKGADFNGEELTIGQDFVDDLKENDTFDWRFVDDKKADRGLENQDYYLKIEIPEDFSQNATTLENVHPEKLELIYTADEGSNYLSSKIGDSAIEKIKEEVSGAVTKTYAESMYDQIKDVADGLNEASDGAGKLNEKLGDATNGSDELHDGIDSAHEGAGKLADGLGDAQAGANKLGEGVGSVQQGAEDLSSGISSVNSGAQELKEKLQALAGKSVAFSTGVDTAYSGSKRIADGLQSFDTAVSQMQDGNQELLGGAEKSQQGAKDLSNGLHQSLSGLQEMNDKLPTLTEGSQEVAAGAQELSGKATDFQSGAAETKKGSDDVSGGLMDATANLDALIQQEQDPDQKERLKSLMASLTDLTDGSQEVSGGLAQISENASLLAQKSQDLSSGAKKVNQGQTNLMDGFNEVTKGQATLANGSDLLMAGQDRLVAGLTTFGNKLSTAKQGLQELENGSSALTTGLGKLDDGTTALEEGSAKLANGSSDLADGTSRLSSGSDKLVNGIGGLYAGSDKLYNGLGELSKGSNDLSSGLGRLTDGSIDLTDGLYKLTDGSSELETELADGAKDANDVNANEDIYDMFAKPVTLTDEPIHDVPNYGTGFTPYFLSLSLFVGALVISIVFPLREPAVKPSSGFGWFLGKFGVLMFAGVFQALLADTILLLGLGLEVTSIPLFIMMSILASWTFLSIVQFLVTTLDNPGRFLGIMILILQLTSSAGTYPIELVPEPLQHFTNFLPMTYTISAFRAIISTGDYAFMWHNVLFTLLFLFIATGGTILYLTFRFRSLRQKQYREIEA
ncbi:YhgE/Pip domain-containing protein [Bacillus sp. BHET2]|uniref:YhgE/Pip domain-containing protein n=1 Tax=Bacillus sp. BHET2 TaxID=2583818 RepID=UPI00110E639D|nr:YhgE/Pip domain-containing protein [Bacillus sp. BHET2]TMU84267.1 YhgE/Pip domain-containing protein [Bacillus sp. BHET2]